MAGTITAVEANVISLGDSMREITIDWTSDSNGDVKDADGKIADALSKSKIEGYIVAVETIPGENGDRTADLPTDLYDVTILDKYGFDIMAGNLANRSGTVAERVDADQTLIVNSELTLTISSAGDTKQGRIIIFMRIRS